LNRTVTDFDFFIFVMPPIYLIPKIAKTVQSVFNFRKSPKNPKNDHITTTKPTKHSAVCPMFNDRNPVRRVYTPGNHSQSTAKRPLTGTRMKTRGINKSILLRTVGWG
jgi:hypothetical protein